MTERAGSPLDTSDPAPPPAVVMLSGSWFLAGCAAAAGVVIVVGQSSPTSVWLLAVEVLATILGLFVFGSFRYQIHKNALTYGMLLVIIATFCELPASRGTPRWPTQGWRFWIAHTS